MPPTERVRRPGLHDEVGEYCIVNFYHLSDIEDPKQVVEEHRKYLANKDIKGRIWISSQGINAQFGGLTTDATEYTQWVSQQPHFQGLRYSVWAAEGHMFPKLRLKHKPNLISLAGGMTTLPITDPSARATPLAPPQWKEMLAQAVQINQNVEEGKEQGAKKVVVLDVRNDYEWDAGHFDLADRPAEEEFAETPVGEEEMAVPEPLKGADPDTPVMMYCTGGIRCDVYSTFLRSKGFNKLYTLEGGIQNYLRQEGAQHWRGSLFVFDGRMALPAGNESAHPDCAAEEGNLPAAVPCQLCGSAAAQLPHVNCANMDCNELFIACSNCKQQLQGCCCSECTTAPRLLRPIQLEGGHYGSWGNYADPDSYHKVIARGRSSEGRLARRRKRREASKARQEQILAQRQERKQLMREAMARAQELEEARAQMQQLQTS